MDINFQTSVVKDVTKILHPELSRNERRNSCHVFFSEIGKQIEKKQNTGKNQT